MAHRLIVGGDLVLYGDVGDLWGDGSGFTAREVIDALAELNGGDVIVRLNSGGGSAFEGIAIYNALRVHPGRVLVSVDAIAASAASVIAMAGDDIVMRSGAMMMIHDPSGLTWGTAEDHRASANMLDGLGDTAAGIYARRTGLTVEEVREMMLAETWLDADAAVEAGFATEVDEATAEAVTKFDFSMFGKTPDHIAAAGQRPRPVSTAAPAARQKEPAMAVKTTDPAAGSSPAETTPTPVPEMQAAPPPASVAPPAPPAPTASVDTTREIMSRCRAAKLTLDATMEIVEAAGGSVEKAKDLIIDRMAANDPQPEQGTATVVSDGRDRFVEGATRALLFRARMDGGEVNEFTSMTLRELARAHLMNVGIKKQWGDPMQMVGDAMGLGGARMSAGHHSTSDFVEVLANVANKAMLKGFMEADETFDAWTAAGVLTDFKPAKRVDLNLFPNLAEVIEGAEYTYATMGDRGESIQLATYGRMFPITRQAIVNDDMNAFTRIPARMGRAAHRTIGNLVYAILVDNPTMSDNVDLFHNTHGNLAGSGAVPTSVTVGVGRAAMARQKDPDQHAAGGLNIRPAFLIVASELEGLAKTLMAAENDPGKADRVPNPVYGMAQVIADARIPAYAWFLAANPNQHDTIEVAYLNGNRQPTLEQRDGWNVDGVEFKVRIDAGVKALDYRGLYKNPGTAPT